ncbi:cation-transporting P-type ATPase [Micromonospora coriariae]|uniref:cation-transporting P-type ATPase n=1 Tax=Micromonospora coriariae TaxID=285665 RepID=UPI00155F6233|nr:cation-transporting P-type ATPase [Micromonospora coriariae]
MSASAHEPGNTSASDMRHREPRARRWRVEAPHGLAGAEVLAGLDVDPERGLASDEVIRRRSVVGRNAPAMPTQRSSWRILLDQVCSVVIVLLATAVVAGLLIGETLEAAAVAVVIIVNTLVGFVTELRALRSMEALRHLTAARADVERQDRREEIDAVELVPGDLVSV